jgi:putative flippase GtrA
MFMETTTPVVVNGSSWNQFIKFCIVGASSTVIDAGLFNLLHLAFGLHPYFARTLSFSVAVINGFIWNSLWTFRGLGSGSRHAQFVKFAAINVVGLFLNLLIMSVVYYLLSGHLPRAHDHAPLRINIALGAAIVVVAFWNFGANKYWTFRGVRQ